MYTKNWAKLQKLDLQASRSEVWTADIHCSFQLIKGVIGGQSQIFYLLSLKFRYWKTSENCFLCRCSVSVLSSTRNRNRRKPNMLSIRITSVQKLHGDEDMPYISSSCLMTLSGEFCLCLRTQSIWLCCSSFLQIFSLVSVKSMLAKNLDWKYGSGLRAQWTKPKYCILRQEHEAFWELQVSECSLLLLQAPMVYNLPRKRIKIFLFLLVLLEGWISTSLFRELIASPDFQLMFIHSHFKAISCFVNSALEYQLLYSL